MVMNVVTSVVAGAVNLIGSFAPPAGLTITDLAWALRVDRELREQTQDYERYWSYYRGEQDDPASASSTTLVPGHNLVAPFVDMLVDRLLVTGFTATNLGEAEAQKLGKALWAWWQASRMDEHQMTLHTRSIAQGDAYLHVWFDSTLRLPRYTFYNATVITPVYDANHVMTAAYKVWTELYRDDRNQPHTRTRLTKFEPARILKFFSVDSQDWRLWTTDLDSNGQPDGGVVEWVDLQGRPLGIPIVHFKHKPLGEDFGHAEVADLIPFQDEFNRRVFHTGEAAAYQGDQITVILDARKPGELRKGPAELWAIESNSKDLPARIETIPAGEVAPLEDVTERYLRMVAGLAGRPVHLVWAEGALPSGESLKVAEAPLVSEARRQAVVFGNAWENVAQIAIRLANTFAGAGLPETAILSAQWASHETRSALTDEQVITLRADDLPWEARMQERGYDADTIEAMRETLEADGTGAPGGPDMAAVDAQIGRLGAVSGEPDAGEVPE